MQNQLKIRILPVLGLITVVIISSALGFWQLNRAHEKEALQAQIEAAAKMPLLDLSKVIGQKQLPTLMYRHIRLTGEFMPEYTVYLDNRPYQDRAGFYVVMPLKIDRHHIILVNRGWIPRDPEIRTKITNFITPTGRIIIEGFVRADPTRLFELGSEAEHNQALTRYPSIRANLAADHFALETKLPLSPFFIMQTSDNADGLIRDWPNVASSAVRNYGYMVQWWALAVAALVYGIILVCRARRCPE